MSVFSSNLQAVRQRVAKAAIAAGREPRSVRIIAVSKTFGAQAIAALSSTGQCDFGENYLQEALPKMALAKEEAIARGVAPFVWHMIGPLQSNKTRLVAEHFDWVHTVERIKIAERLSEQRPAHFAPLEVCIQVNISAEATKSGVLPEALPELVLAVAVLPRIRLRGLMAIPRPGDASAFGRLAALRDSLRAEHADLTELSMGMSADLEDAIAKGATMVRVGTAIFGARGGATLERAPSSDPQDS